MKPTQRLEIPVTLQGCKTVRELVDNAELKAQFSPEVVAHCQHCADCQSYSQQLASLRGLVANQVRVTAPADFDIKLRQRIAASRQSGSNLSWWQMMMRPAFAVPTMAALVMAFVVGTYIQMPGSQQRPPETASVQNSNQPPAKPNQPENIQKPTHADPTTDPDASHMAKVDSSVPKSVTTDVRTRVGSDEMAERRRAELDARRVAVDNSRMMALRNGSRDGERVNLRDLDAPRGRATSSAPSMTVVYGARPVVTTVDSNAFDVDRSSDRDEPTIF